MEALMKFLTDTLIDPFTFDCSSQDKTDVDQFYKSYTQANYLLFDNQFRSSIEKIYQINHFPSFTSNHFKNFFWELLFYRPKEGLKLDEKYLRQKVVDIKGYKVPLTLAHILNTLLHRYTESDLFGESVWNWTPGIKSVFATTFCMVNGDDLVVVRVINDSWNVWDDLKWSKIKVRASREFVKGMHGGNLILG
uniref:Uncharacterized protein n=1 Tax=Cannabis sativa TaxID=3483 RepID=A0A803QA47_CANSA